MVCTRCSGEAVHSVNVFSGAQGSQGIADCLIGLLKGPFGDSVSFCWTMVSTEELVITGALWGYDRALCESLETDNVQRAAGCHSSIVGLLTGAGRFPVGLTACRAV